MTVCRNIYCQINQDITTDPMYWLGASFFSGFLFSYWNWGIVYVVLFLIVWEIIYFGYHWYREYNYQGMIRIGCIAGVIFGFLINRAIIEQDDHYADIQDFWNNGFW